MNIRILNRVNAWKVAGRLEIARRKRKETVVREVKDRNVKMNVEINEIEKIDGNLMENSGDKN
jgi:hydroxypyruvate isomerase